jgi:hypothetical protein
MESRSRELARPDSERALPSGRLVIVRSGGAAGGDDEIEVRSPAGEVEVRIACTAAGPVVTVRGGRLEIESSGALALRAPRVEVDAGEMRVRTEGDIRMNGAKIHLNCTDEEEAAAVETARALEARAAKMLDMARRMLPGGGSCGHGHAEGHEHGED